MTLCTILIIQYEADRELLSARLQELEAGWLPEGQRRAVSSAKALLAGDACLGGPVGLKDFPLRRAVVLHADGSRPGARSAAPGAALWWSSELHNK